MVFRLGAFGKGVVTGLATGLDTAAQSGFERVRDNIDEFSKTTLEREQKAIEETQEEADEVLTELRTAQAVLGGVDDPKSAARAAALLKDVGSLSAFKSVVASLQEQKVNEESYDFNKYFDNAMDLPGVNLANISTNYVLDRKQPFVDVAAPDMKGGGFGRLFGVNIAERVKERTQAQLASMGLARPQKTDIQLPEGFKFKSEAFKLDRMDPDQERDYIRNKMRDPDTPTERMDFYRSRLTELGNRMGLPGRIEDLTFKINMESDDTKRTSMMLQLQQLNREQREVEILSTGDPVKIKEYELSQAIVRGNTTKANEIRRELQKMGALSLADIVTARTEQLFADQEAGKDVTNEIEALATLNKTIKDTKESIAGMPDPTASGVNAAMNTVTAIVNREIRNNPKFAQAGITINMNGSIEIPDGIDENIKQEIAAFRDKATIKVVNDLKKSMPRDADMAVAHAMLTQGFNISDVNALTQTADVTTTITEAQVTDDPAGQELSGPVVQTIPESIANRTDLNEEEKVKVAGAQKIYGAKPDANNIMNLFSDIHDDDSKTTGGANILSSVGVENLLKSNLEKIYGPTVASQFESQIKDYAAAYAGFDDAALDGYPADSLDGQIVSVIRDLEKSNPDFTIEAIAPIVKERFYKGDRSVDIPGIMGSVTKIITRHRKQRPSEGGFISPEKLKEINAVRRATGQPELTSAEAATEIQSNQNQQGPNPSFTGPLSNNPFFDEQSGFDMDMERTTSDIKETSPKFDVEEAAEKQFRTRDDLPTGSEAPGPPDAQFDQAEQDQKFDVRKTADADRQKRIDATSKARRVPLANFGSMRGASALQLATAVGTGGKKSNAAIEEIKRRIDNNLFSTEEMTQIRRIISTIRGQK